MYELIGTMFTLALGMGKHLADMSAGLRQAQTSLIQLSASSGY